MQNVKNFKILSFKNCIFSFRQKSTCKTDDLRILFQKDHKDFQKNAVLKTHVRDRKTMVPLITTNIILTLTRIDAIKIDRKPVQTLFVYFAMLFHQFNYDLANVFASFYFSLQAGNISDQIIFQ